MEWYKLWAIYFPSSVIATLLTTPEPSEELSPFIVDPTWPQSELLYLNNRKDPELASPLPSLWLEAITTVSPSDDKSRSTPDLSPDVSP